MNQHVSTEIISTRSNDTSFPQKYGMRGAVAVEIYNILVEEPRMKASAFGFDRCTYI